MSNARPWIAGAAGAGAVLLLAGWFLAISPERSKAADLHTETTSQQQANQRLQLDIAQLKVQDKTLPAKQAELAVIQRQMPDNPGLPTLIRNLSSMASASGVDLKTVAPGAPTAFVGGSHQSAAGSTSSTSSGTTAAAATPSSNLVSIPVTFTLSGTYAQNELFLQKLENSMTRVMWVNSIALTPAAADTSTTGGTSTSTTPDTTTSATTATSPNLQMVISGTLFVLKSSTDASTTVPATGNGTGAASTSGTAN